jgi:hypothetical protein
MTRMGDIQATNDHGWGVLAPHGVNRDR